MSGWIRKIDDAAEFLQNRWEGRMPEILVVLGSGLGSFTDAMTVEDEVPYNEIPHFPVATVAGHAGKLVLGTVGSVRVAAMKGRFHYYEGHDISIVTLPVRVFARMGVGRLVVTNAAGGMNKTFEPGTLMLITDHIGSFAPSALRGPNIEELGPRFNDMSDTYTTAWRETAKTLAEREGVRVREGVYVFAQGPMYETPAEIRALSLLGGDAVGMSTVPEVQVARHAGMKILGISCITNMAAGIQKEPLSHTEVMETAARVEKDFVRWVAAIVRECRNI